MNDPTAWYDTHAETAVARYENVCPHQIYRWCAHLLPPAPATALDIGAGSGRDAAFMASKGYDVLAVEPSQRMRTVGSRLHAEASFQWVDDRLPSLAKVTSYGLTFNLILINAVWMHIAQGDRPRSFRKLVNLLKPGGLLLMIIPKGHPDTSRGFFPVSRHEIETLARGHGAYTERYEVSDDLGGRDQLQWESLAIRLPDDGSGALPLLRHIILNDNKSSTYKLALLRVLCRIANGSAGMARDLNEDLVAVPLGLVALTWIRLFQPLLAKQLPQTPRNIGFNDLGFAKDAFRILGEDSRLNLRVGMTFRGRSAAVLHRALKDAANNIARMPATHTTYPNGHRVFPVKRKGRIYHQRDIVLDQTYLSHFGDMCIPQHLWVALRRFDAWIEPSIVMEWSRLIKQYAERQGRSIDDAVIFNSMVLEEDDREVKLAREQALSMIEREPLFCMWSQKRLTSKNLDIDHCFPWSAWPCGDLWNLMPAHRHINQHKKRDRLPADTLLRQAEEQMMGWWSNAFIDNSPPVSERFWLEAQSSLPSRPLKGHLDDVFDAVRIQGKRLKHDQQIPEWDGEKTS